MLGRKEHTTDELDNGRPRIDRQLTAYRDLAKGVPRAGDGRLSSALMGFEGEFFNNLALVLDRLYVHRLRSVTGKDGNPLNELELISESLMNNGGILRGNKVIRYVPEEAVVRLREGDEIELTAKEFERLSAGVFDELESKFR